MFLALIERAIIASYKETHSVRFAAAEVQERSNHDSKDDSSSIIRSISISMSISITVYNAKSFQYPTTEQEWNSYQGILLPGSFSSAYDEIPWIIHLKHVIQTEIHPKGRKTLAVCFGHQVFAHSFSGSFSFHSTRTSHKGTDQKEQHAGPGQIDEGILSYDSKSDFQDKDGNGNGNGDREDTSTTSCHIRRNNDRSGGDFGGGGLATPCPSGTQVGIRGCQLDMDLMASWNRGKTAVKNDDTSETSIGMMCTDGDGDGDGDDPCKILYTHGDMVHSLPDHCSVSLGGTEFVPIQAAAYFQDTHQHTSTSTCTCTDKSSPRGVPPYAFTFQGHPEYAVSELGIETFCNVLKKMEEREHGRLDAEMLKYAREDALRALDGIDADCVNLMQLVAKILGWI